MTKIVNNSTSRLTTLKMKNALNKWKDAVHKARYNELKANIFVQNVTHVDSRMDRIKMKYYLDKWRRHVPSGKRILDIQEGANLLQKFALKTIIKEPLKAMTEKCEEKNLHNRMASLFVIKRRKIRDRLRANAFAIQLPIGAEDKMQGIIDLIEMKAEIYRDDLGKQFDVFDVDCFFQKFY